jgi:hypothetical protein
LEFRGRIFFEGDGQTAGDKVLYLVYVYGLIQHSDCIPFVCLGNDEVLRGYFLGECADSWEQNGDLGLVFRRDLLIL